MWSLEFLKAILVEVNFSRPLVGIIAKAWSDKPKITEKLAPETSALSQDNGHEPSATVEAQTSCWAYSETQTAQALQPASSLCSSTHYKWAARLSGLLSASCVMGPVKQPEKRPVPYFFIVP